MSEHPVNGRLEEARPESPRRDLQGRHFRHNGQPYLPTWEVRERIPVDTSTLIYWHHEGCHYLGGNPLRARRDRRGWRAKMKHPPWGWHAGDVDKIVRARASELPVYKDRDYIRLRDAVRAFGFPGPTIQGWSKKGCPHLGGRKLRPKPLKGIGQGPREVKGYCVADLRMIAGRLHKKVDPYLLPVTNAAGTWLPAKLVQQDERYGFYWNTVYGWHSKGCPHLDGRELRADWFPLEPRGRGRWRKKLCFLEEDLDEIVRRRAETQRGRRAMPSEDDEGTWLPAWLVTERYGFSAMSLHYWRKNGCCHLEGSKLGFQRVPVTKLFPKGVPRGYGRTRILVYLQTDLERIATRKAGGEPSNGAKAGDTTAGQPAVVTNGSGKARAPRSTGKKGGRPREREGLWDLIQEADQRDPKPPDKAIAGEFNQRFARAIKDGKRERATAQIVKTTRRDYRRRVGKGDHN